MHPLSATQEQSLRDFVLGWEAAEAFDYAAEKAGWWKRSMTSSYRQGHYEIPDDSFPTDEPVYPPENNYPAKSWN